MFAVPEGTAALDGGKDGEIVAGRRRAGGPFQGPGVPGIGAGLFALEVGRDHVPDEDEGGDRLEDGAAGDNLVQQSPATVGFVGVDTARHAEDAGDVHEVEGEME